MTAKVLPFTGLTRLDLDPDLILSEAQGKLEGAVVMGYDKEGNLYFASSYADGGTIMWLMELSKHFMLKELDEMEDDE